MKSVSAFMETITQLSFAEKINIPSNVLEHKNVRDFLHLGKKVLVDKQKLSRQEQNKLQQLFKTDEVQELLGYMAAVGSSKLTRIVPATLVSLIGASALRSYLIAFGFSPTASISIALVGAILSVITIMTVMGKVVTPREHKKIVGELQQLGLMDRNLKIQPTWRDALFGSVISVHEKVS